MGDKKQRIIPAHYSWNSSIFTRGVVDPIKRKLGWVDENERPVSLEESATGQELNRMKDVAESVGKLAATGLAFSNPVTASATMAPLITGSQAYFMSEGLRDAYNRVMSSNKTAKDGAMVALDVAGAIPAFSAIKNGAKYVLPTAAKTVAPVLISKQILKTKLPTVEPTLNIGWGPKQTLKVSHTGEYDQMYFPERWDVVNEGANPHGIWLQGKYGTPRTDATNLGKGIKAAKARNIFSTRPDKYTGTATLDKPMVTVGEVPNRSSLSYQADNMGADGLIYNGVYDNGYNNNQVILSFRRPELTKTQLSEAERLGIPKGVRNQPDNTILPTKGFDVIPTNKNNFYRVSGPSEITDISEFGKLRIDPIARFDQMQLRIINEQTGIPMERLYEINASDNPRAIQNLVMESEAYKSASPFDQFNMKLSAARPKSNHGDKGFQRGAFFSIYDPNNPTSKYYGAPTIVGTTRKSSFLGGHHGDYRGEWNLDIPVGSGQNSGSAVLRNGFEKENFKYWKLGNDGKWYLNNFKQGGILKLVASGKSGIHIKPENRGKLTRLKKRTGKSEAELWKEGNPAVRKMITFARNSRKWKH